jgi:hypothetical protein
MSKEKVVFLLEDLISLSDETQLISFEISFPKKKI